MVPSQPHELKNSLNSVVLSRDWRVWGRRRSCGALVCLPRKPSFRGPGGKAAKLIHLRAGSIKRSLGVFHVY